MRGVSMIRTLEAVIDENGNVGLLETIHLSGARRALVTIREDAPGADETALLSEEAWGEDRNRPDEDEAWSHLQQRHWSFLRFVAFPTETRRRGCRCRP
jgi:hypothetical protein